ncbi:hypothetical protein CDD82_5309 [Ophiocordyceps australis]|uniref:Uncharacterized protein n=1 Tax=Ophiocordyceps australis TaxID=1399860 RepID=A0A2C5Y6K7_9HYPO|nr:hypothetical protein CDD82_5309 [Ophiocordyceps australis]
MADGNMNYLYTIGGYAALLGIGFTIYHLSVQKANSRRAMAINKASKNAGPEPRKEDRKKKQRLTSFTSEAKTRAKSGDETSLRRDSAPMTTSDDGDDNREFARQLAKAQQGTNLNTKPEGSKQREKSIKQSRASKMANKSTDEANVQTSGPSAPSSAAGVDAGASTDADADADTDDNSSAVQSPQLAAVDASGVGDMLEPAPAGPSTLRIIDDKPQAQKPKAANKPVENKESKKQRQNRKKAEAAKAARESAEQERKALEEKQRRTARIAEGRAAKDGSQSMATKAPPSAWAEGAPQGAVSDSKKAAQNTTVLHQPLETSGKSTELRSQGSWMSSLPSEEEQMEMLRDEADEWNTVTSKASKRASKKTSSVSSSDEKAVKETEAVPKKAQKPAAPVTSSSKAPRPGATKQFGGSFSALNTNDEVVDEVEEEWDV